MIDLILGLVFFFGMNALFIVIDLLFILDIMLVLIWS